MTVLDTTDTTVGLAAEVMRNALVVAAEEASIVVVRSAYSTFIVEGSDASAAILDRDGRLIAHSMATTLMNSMALSVAVPYLLADHPAETMRPGDVFATNDAYKGGVHTNDILVFKPDFRRRQGGVLHRHADPRLGHRRWFSRRYGVVGHRHLRRRTAVAAGPDRLRRRSRGPDPADPGPEQPDAGQGGRRCQGPHRGRDDRRRPGAGTDRRLRRRRARRRCAGLPGLHRGPHPRRAGRPAAGDLPRVLCHRR